MDKIFAITDVHFGIDRKSLTHPDFFRQNNSQALKELKTIPKYLPENINLYIQMGDLIRNIKDNYIDNQHLKKINDSLQKNFPKIHNVIGNHDSYLNNLPIIQNIISFELENCKVIIINSEIEQVLSKNEIQILKSLVSKSANKPILIFTHIPLFPVNSNGNYYFYKKEPDQYFKNYQEILCIFKSALKVFIISGHYHWLSATEITPNIKQITLPAFCENIITTPKCEIHPCVYNLIETNKDTLTIKSYSRQFCFGSLEFSIPH